MLDISVSLLGKLPKNRFVVMPKGAASKISRFPNVLGERVTQAPHVQAADQAMKEHDRLGECV